MKVVIFGATGLSGKGLKYTITLADLAKFMVGQLKDKKYLKQAPSISNKNQKR